jgi:hypothetical protein
MPKIIVVAAALAFGVSAAMAQTMSAADSALKDSLSMDQQRQIGEIITNDPTAPLTHINFSLSVDSVVPAEIELRRLPPAAEELAPQFKGHSYIVVEEQIALADPRTRKIVTVIPRWRSQEADTATKRGRTGSGERDTR